MCDKASRRTSYWRNHLSSRPLHLSLSFILIYWNPLLSSSALSSRLPTYYPSFFLYLSCPLSAPVFTLTGSLWGWVINVTSSFSFILSPRHFLLFLPHFTLLTTSFNSSTSSSSSSSILFLLFLSPYPHSSSISFFFASIASPPPNIPLVPPRLHLLYCTFPSSKTDSHLPFFYFGFFTTQRGETWRWIEWSKVTAGLSSFWEIKRGGRTKEKREKWWEVSTSSYCLTCHRLQVTNHVRPSSPGKQKHHLFSSHRNLHKHRLSSLSVAKAEVAQCCCIAAKPMKESKCEKFL